MIFLEILKGLEIHGNALFLKRESVLILSDLHIGFDASLNANGILIPRFQYSDLFSELQRLLRELKPKLVVLNGDIKHEFSGILREEGKFVLEFLDFINKRCELVIVKGNHDSILKPLVDKLNLELRDYFVIGDFFICHGDRLFDNDDFKSCKFVIIGHEHPAVSLRSGVRVEKYRCFLHGSFQGKKLIVMPAMNPSSEGSDVLVERLLSPFLKNNSSFWDFKVFVVESGESYDFGVLRNLKS